MKQIYDYFVYNENFSQINATVENKLQFFFVKNKL